MPKKLTGDEIKRALSQMILLVELKPNATIKDYREVTGLSATSLYKIAQQYNFSLGNSYDCRETGVLKVIQFRGKPQVNVTAAFLRQVGLDSVKEVAIVAKGGRVILERYRGKSLGSL